MKKRMKILITTGIYPPKIGGPAQYALNLKESFERMGHFVYIKTFNIENSLPTGIRHIFFFIKIIPAVLRADVIFALDTFSVGLPTSMASGLFGKKMIIRTGGDFLWEQYIERTGRKILLRNFYSTERSNLSFKEKLVFRLTKWTLHNTVHIIFSTDWQRDIFINAYNLDKSKTSIVENYYGHKEEDIEPTAKEFIGSTRKLVGKNLDTLENVFKKIQKDNPEVSLYERIKDAGIFVDPLNENEIEAAILNLLTENGYKKAKEKVRNFNFVHTWEQIADEFLNVLII